MRSRKLATALAVGLAAVSVSACATTAEEQDAVSLRFYTLAWQPGAVESTEAVVAAWNEQNPDINVELVRGDWDSIDDFLTTSFEGGTAPDLFHYEGFELRKFADRGNLLNLDDVLSSEFVGSISDQAWETVQYDGLEGTWGVPFLQEPVMLYANLDLVEAAGAQLPEPSEGWTWDEFRSFALALTEDGQYGASFALRGSGAMGRVINIGQGFGADYFSDAGGSWSTQLGDEELAFPRILRDLIVEDGSMSADVLGLGSSDLTTNFLRGEYATYFGGAYLRSQIVEGSPSFDWVALPAPSGPEGSLQSNSAQTISISASSEHPQEAAEFLEFFLNAENQVSLALGDWLLPTNVEALADPRLAEPSVSGDTVVAAAANLQFATYQRIGNFSEWAGEVAPIFAEYYTGAISEEELTSRVIEAGDAVLERLN